MSLTLDHIVILVSDLAAASADYTSLGFTVVPGGEHADGATHNALVAFADGVYLELIAFQRAAQEHRWWRHTPHGEGLVDWALLPSDITADIAAVRARGLAFEGPFPGGRNRPDGERLEWQSGLPATLDLPFLCADVTPRTLRVPGGAAQQHANGATGVAGLSVAVFDLATSLMHYRALLGEIEMSHAEESHATFALGSATLTLRAPAADLPDDDVVRARLAANGEGPFALKLAGSSALDAALTHGVRFV